MLSPFIFVAIKNDSMLFVILMAAWVILTDYLDGTLARRLDSITRAGKILDPLADKLCVAAAAIALTAYNDFPFILMLIIVGRDFFIILFGLTIIKKLREIPVSNYIGKATALVLALTLLVYIFRLKSIYDLAFFAAMLFVILSSVSYLFTFYKYFFTKRLNKS